MTVDSLIIHKNSSLHNEFKHSIPTIIDNTCLSNLCRSYIPHSSYSNWIDGSRT